MPKFGGYTEFGREDVMGTTLKTLFQKIGNTLQLTNVSPNHLLIVFINLYII